MVFIVDITGNLEKITIHDSLFLYYSKLYRHLHKNTQILCGHSAEQGWSPVGLVAWQYTETRRSVA